MFEMLRRSGVFAPKKQRAVKNPKTALLPEKNSGCNQLMKKKFLSELLRYCLALGAFALVLGVTLGIPRVFGVNLDLTSLMILVMIASAWYLGLGPGLLVALVFEATLDYFSTAPFTAKSAVIVFNRLLLFISLVVFASSRRKAEKLLREQREWLEVTLSSIGDAVIATDINGRVKFINATAEALTGWTPNQAAGKPLEEVFRIVDEETGEPSENPFTVVTREGNVVGPANHTNLIAKNGAEIPIENSGAPIKDSDGAMIGVIIVFHDVSERRQIERQRTRLLKQEQLARTAAEAASRSKDEFLATVSHELRTPLSAILGWSSIINKGNFEEKTVRDALEVIERNARSQALIIDDIFDVSRIHTGKFTLDLQEVEFAAIVRTAIASLLPEADAKSIVVKTSLNEPSGGAPVQGDPVRLRQIVLNLIANAIKFTPENGEIKIALNVVGAEVELKISDNGIGISEEFLPFIFEKFRQADSSATRSYGGLGLGLSLVRQLVELHGGTASADSAGEGQGATFTVRLPLLQMPSHSAYSN